tara:strand:- start:2108 stop:2536 length:429 start_codon:yes stop_codon:yes gene_type:complete
MSKEELLTYDEWDYKDVIKDIKLSTIFIISLQNIIQDMIYSEDRIETVGDTFKKFDKIKDNHNNGESDVMKDIELDNWEKQIYALFSILQVLKAKAYEQKLNKPTKTTATMKDIKEISKLMMEGSDKVQEKLEELASKTTLA